MNNIKQSFLSGLVFLGTVITGFIGFATYTSLPNQNTGDTINQSIWNNVINKINDIGTKVDTLSNLPTGAIMSFYLSDCPTGWILADGTNSTPDLRGEFVRGLDKGRRVDAGRTLGSLQRGSLVMNTWNNNNIYQISHNTDNSLLGYDAPIIDSTKTYYWADVAAGAYTTWGVGSIDTNYIKMARPRNVALLYCMKQ